VTIYDTYDPQPKYSKLAKPLHITTAKGSGFRGIIKELLQIKNGEANAPPFFYLLYYVMLLNMVYLNNISNARQKTAIKAKGKNSSA